MRRAPDLAWGAIFLGEALIPLCGIASGMLAARLLGPEGRGALAAILFWPQLIAGIGVIGLPEAVTFRVATADSTSRRRIMSTAVVLALVLAVVASLAGYAALPTLLGVQRGTWLPLARHYLLAFLPFNFVALSLLGADHGDQRFARLSVLRLLPSLVYLAALLALWVTGEATIGTVVWASWLGTSGATAIRLLWIVGEFGGRPSLAEAGRLLRVACAFHLTALLTMLASQIDRAAVIWLWGDRAVGLYAAALTVATTPLSVVTHSVHIIVFPRVAAAESDRARREIVLWSLRYASLILVAAAALFLASLPWLVPLLFGEAFQDSIAPGLALVAACLPLALRQLIAGALRALGETRPGAVAEALGVVLFLVLFWPLTRTAGLAGVGLALLGGNAGALIYLSRRLGTRLGLLPRQWWGINASTVEGLLQDARRFAESFRILPGGS